MIDLMVLDVVIPQIHGLNLLKLFRSNTPALPVIVISAYLSEPAGKVILEGSAEFFSKPLDLQQLSQIIQTLLSTAPRPH